MMVIKETKYLVFEELPTKTKTRYVNVINIRSGNFIGEIKWYGPWRQYCFFPDMDTVWNPKCLDDVNAVIRELMEERKVKK